MAPSIMIAKLPMSPQRVMVMVLAVAAICVIFSAFRAPPKTLKLGAMLEQPSAAAVDGLHVKRDTSGRTMADPTFWKTFNFQSESIPEAVIKAAPKVNITTNTINIMGTNTFYREACQPAGVDPSGEVVVLLHGAAFKSATWVELNTINLLAAMGHRVIAVDLPGYGQSKEATVQDKPGYLHSLLSQLNAKTPIVVSPSMSGGFSVPFLLKHAGGIAGYVPVAPVGTGEGKADYPKILVPTLIIYGEKDTGLGHTSRANLCNLPNSQAVQLPKATHPAYLDQPDMFHKLLYNFIKQVHDHRAVDQ